AHSPLRHSFPTRRSSDLTSARSTLSVIIIPLLKFAEWVVATGRTGRRATLGSLAADAPVRVPAGCRALIAAVYPLARALAATFQHGCARCGYNAVFCGVPHAAATPCARTAARAGAGMV